MIVDAASGADDLVLAGQLPGAAVGPERHQHHRRQRLVPAARRAAGDEGLHVGHDRVGLVPGAAGHLGVDRARVAEDEDAVVPLTCSVGRVRTNPSASARRGQVAGQVAGHRPDAVGSGTRGRPPSRRPDGVRTRERAELARVPSAARSGAASPEHEAHAALGELAPQLRAQRGVERPAQHVVGATSTIVTCLSGHARVISPASSRPTGPAPMQQHAVGGGQRLVRLP